MYELNAIERACSRTLAGLRSFVLIDPNDLVTQPRWNIVPNVDVLDFKPGAGAYTFHCAIHSMRMDDETDPSNNGGDLFQYKLTGFARVIRGEVELLRAKLVHRRIHVVATYHDGSQRFIPYMRITMKADSGARGGLDRPGYYLDGTATLNRPAPFVEGTFDIIGGPAGSDPAPPDGTINVVSITTSDSTYSYSIPDGMLLIAIYITGTNAQEVSAGLTPGGYELGGPIPLTSTTPGNRTTMETVLRAAGSTPVYLHGLVGTNTIELWIIGE